MKQLRAVPTPPQPVRPSILDSRFKYTPAAATDITQTWRRFGWKPLAEKTRK
jgi:hypothetical protein